MINLDGYKDSFRKDLNVIIAGIKANDSYLNTKAISVIQSEDITSKSVLDVAAEKALNFQMPKSKL